MMGIWVALVIAASILAFFAVRDQMPVIAHQPFRVPIGLRIRYKVAWLRKWLAGVMVVLVFVLGFGLWLLISSPAMSSRLQSPESAGLFGALMGALVGAAVGGLVSLYTHNQEIKSESTIRRKHEIYEPLFESLVRFRDDLRSSGLRYEASKVHHLGNFGFEPVSKYRATYVQVPSWIVKAVEQHVEDCQRLAALNREAAENLYLALAFELEEEQGPERRLDEKQRYSILYSILNDDFERFHNSFAVEGQLFEVDDAGKWWQHGLRLAEETESVRALNTFYDESIVGHADWLIFELDRLIQYINKVYGGQGNLL